jgi:ABC-2 type transport system permease protein
MKPATAAAPALPPDVRLRRGFELTALAALFVLTLREALRGRRLLVLSLLFLLPAGLAILVRLTPHSPPPPELELALVFYLIPHALATLTALLYAAGIVQDEVEGQTLTYLLLRPLPRWALYLTKLAATVLVSSALVGLFTALALVAIYWDTPELWGEVLPGRALRVAALLALAQAAYGGVFGAVSLLTRWTFIAGLVYIIAFEGLLANVEMVLRRVTVMYYFRVLSLRWLDLPAGRAWSINLATAPGARACLLTLLGVSVTCALLGAVLMTRREFRMKTPDGS